jgi:hypothetical protein
MSKADVAAIRAGWEAWNAEGVGALERFFTEDVEWIDPPTLPGGTTHRGRDATLAFLREWEGSLGIVRLNFRIEDILDLGAQYLVISLAEGSGESGIPIAAHHWFHLLRLRHGKIERAELFLERAEAFAAAGVRSKAADATKRSALS